MFFLDIEHRPPCCVSSNAGESLAPSRFRERDRKAMKGASEINDAMLAIGDLDARALAFPAGRSASPKQEAIFSAFDNAEEAPARMLVTQSTFYRR